MILFVLATAAISNYMAHDFILPEQPDELAQFWAWWERQNNMEFREAERAILGWFERYVNDRQGIAIRDLYPADISAYFASLPMREAATLWQSIETAPMGEESIFWLVPDDFYKNSPDQKKYGHPWFGKINYWEAMYRATHWRTAFDGPVAEEQGRRG